MLCFTRPVLSNLALLSNMSYDKNLEEENFAETVYSYMGNKYSSECQELLK